MLQNDFAKGKKLLEKVSLNLHPIDEALLGPISKSEYDLLLKKMEPESNWREQCSIVLLDDYSKAESKFKHYREIYCGIDGLVNSVVGFISKKEGTAPENFIFSQKKDKAGAFETNDDGSSKQEGKFNVNHSLIWVIKTNNTVFEKPDETVYGEGIKYIIYIYKPSTDMIKTSALIELARKQQIEQMNSEIAAVKTNLESEIAPRKKRSGIRKLEIEADCEIAKIREKYKI